MTSVQAIVFHKVMQMICLQATSFKICLSGPYGCSSAITLLVGGSVARATTANMSIKRLMYRSWFTRIGGLPNNKIPIKLMITHEKFVVTWKIRNLVKF